MDREIQQRRLEKAAAAFNEHEQRSDGLKITHSLLSGFSVVRDAFAARVHADVELNFGIDSMLLPVSVVKGELELMHEVDAFLIAESVLEVRATRHVTDEAWYRDWLLEIRFSAVGNNTTLPSRLESYLTKPPDDRRRAFMMFLERTFPEARRSPLIIYRLLPPAAAIVTDLAFGDTPRAEQARKRQMSWLPQIGDCHECHGRLLDNGEKCAQCGNPFWNYKWLTAD